MVSWRFGPIFLAFLAEVSCVRVGFYLPPLGQALQKDFGKTSTRFFSDLFMHSTAFRERKYEWDDANLAIARFNPEDGDQVSKWQHFNVPEDAVVWRSDGYPSKLNRWLENGKEWRTSTVAHIGKDGAYVASGLYHCAYDGDGHLEFDKDAVVLNRNEAARTITLNISGHGGVRIRLTATNETNPLHGVTIVPAELPSGTGIFHPEFLSQLSSANVLRFAGWANTDANDYNSQNNPRSWEQRTTTTHQTQNRDGGVAVEHMVALCNALHASPWFGLPRTAGTDDAYIAGMAALVRDSLHADLEIYLEYREGGAGALGSEQSRQSITLWSIWETVFGSESHRLVRVAWTRAGWTLERWGADVASIDAFAVAATFGELCRAAGPCEGITNFESEEAGQQYANASVDDVLDRLRGSVLSAEHRWNEERGVVMGAAGSDKRFMAYTSGMDTHAAAYGWRSTWDTLFGPRGCQACLFDRLKTKFGHEMLSTLQGDDGWVAQPSWSCREEGVEYLNVSSGVQAGPPGTVRRGTAAECKGLCEAAELCAGFSYAVDHGECRFVASVAMQRNSENLDAVGGGSKAEECYSRAMPLPAMGTEEAWGECGGRCLHVYTVAPMGEPDLDALHAMAGAVRTGAELEKALDEKLTAAGAHARMKGIMQDALERWSRVAGTDALLVLPALSHLPTRWDFGTGWTDGVSHGDFALTQHPDQSPAPKLDAVQAWIQGDVLELPFTSQPPPALVPCSPACVWGVCHNGTCDCFQGFVGTACDVTDAQNRPENECQGGVGAVVGMNVGGMSYWGTEWTHVDVFKRSGTAESQRQGWTTQRFTDFEWDTNEALNVTADGYPAALADNQVAGRMMIRDLRKHGMSGEYTVLYDGDGIVHASMTDVKTVSRPQPGRLDVTLQLSLNRNNGMWLTIERTNPDDPVRNIRVIAPGFFASDDYLWNPFHPAFVHSLRRYRVLRFMDWTDTNGDHPGQWSDRATEDDLSYVLRGVPVEQAVLLANMVGADAWFCLPHRADRQYMTEIAQLVHSSLRPDRKMYLEYSNEVWHTGFPGGQFAEQEAARLGMTRLCFAVNRTREIAQAARAVVGAGWQARVVVVVSSQASNADATRQILACDDRLIAADIHAVALAPYFDGFDPDETNTTTMLERYRQAMNTSLLRVSEHAAMVRAANLSLVAYEAGPGAPVGSFNDVGIAAHSDPGMEDLVRDYYEGLAATGMQLVMHFSSAGLPSKYGAWGLILATDQNPAESAKQRGLFSYLDAHAQCPFPLPSNCTDGERCSGHGFCLDSGCSCFYGYSGPRCEVVSYTEHDQCGYRCSFDQGVCVPYKTEGLERYWRCECGHEYWGAKCSRHECVDHCNYNGMCLDQGVCNCFPGFHGERCEHDCGCGGHGECAADGGCQCDVGWRRNEGGGCEWDCQCGEGVECVAPGVCGCVACEMGDCVGGQCRCWAGFRGSDCSQRTAKPNDGSTIGMNLAGVGYGLNRVFVDVMKHSGEWVSVPAVDTGNTSADQYIWGDKQAIHQDGDGYVVRLDSREQELVTLSLRDVCTHTASGRFVALYDGEGFLDFGMDATVVSFAKNRIELDFASTCDSSCWFDSAGWRPYCTDNGLYLRLRHTNPLNPIRNIRIVMPGFEHRAEVRPFHPLFVAALQRFSLLRYMDWGHINGQTEVEWSDRQQPSQRSFQHGVPIELMVQLSNLVGADAWFCMPHTANDDYVRQFARLARETLRGDVRVFVEHSNEVWNFAFPQGQFAQAEGERLGLADDIIGPDDNCWEYPTRCPEYRYRYHARRSKQIFALWEEEWGPDHRHRLSFVLSTWTASPHATETILAFEGAGQAADLVGVAAYLGVEYRIDPSVAAKSVDDILDDMRSAIPGLAATLSQHRALAASLGKELVTYEAGPGLVQDGVIFGSATAFGPLTELLIAVARSPGMEQVYREAMEALLQADVFSLSDRRRPLVAFASVGPFSQYGAWGHQEWTGQPLSQAPKLRALLWAIDNATKTTAAAGASLQTACVDPDLHGWGLGLSTRYGPSGVQSPSAGEEWITGREHTIVWNTDEARGRRRTVRISLWRAGTCPGKGTRVLVINRAAPDSGVASFRVSERLPPRGDYMVVVTTARGVFVSEPFWISGGSRFVASAWGPCSQTCGVGVQTRDVQCASTEGAAAVHSVEDQDVSAASVSCLEEDQRLDEQWSWNPWLSRWQLQWHDNTLASHWAVHPDWAVISCIHTGSGCREYRTARHDAGDDERRPPYLYGNFKPVTDCTALSSPHPKTSSRDAGGVSASCALTMMPPESWRMCFQRPCTAAAWVTGEWSVCSVTCGGGTQSRDAECIVSSGARGTEQDCEAAGLTTPHTEQQCNLAACPSVAWSVGEWESCTASCGGGVSTRSVLCVSSSGAVVSARDCPSAARPRSSRSCNDFPCNSTRWEASAWSRCSARCGEGQRTRNVTCVQGEGSVVDDGQCATAKPTEEEECELRRCEELSWVLGEWSECSATCGEGSMERDVLCWSSLAGVMASQRCQLRSAQPRSVQGCTGMACAECGSLASCSGHGACISGQCECEGGYHGNDCTLPPSCPAGSVLVAGECCASGVTDRHGVCCVGGTLDDCGECGQSMAMVDATGHCCHSGVLDAGGLCCEEGQAGLDRCGVCGGRGLTCATGLELVLGGVGGAETLAEEEGEDVGNVTEMVRSALQDWVQKTGGTVTVNSVRASQQDVQRRLQLAGGVEVEATVEGGGPSLLLLLEEGNRTLGSASVVSLAAGAVGVCGNQVCEQGERCDEGAEECCAEDCAFSLSTCGSAVANMTCSGHGVCLTGQGQCDCFQGYGGVHCDHKTAQTVFSTTPSASLAQDLYSADGNTQLAVGVVRSSGLQFGVQVTLSTSDVTAISGTNYEPLLEHVIEIPAGQSEGSVMLALLDGSGTLMIAITRVLCECSVGAGQFECVGEVGVPGSATVSMTGLDVSPGCGDGVLDETEACDDGNSADDDGCSAQCVVERGFTCGGQGVACELSSTPAAGEVFVRGSTELTGLSAVEFVVALRAAFRVAMARVLSLDASQVLIEAINRRRSSAQSSAVVDFRLVVSAEQGAAVAAGVESVYADGRLQDALLHQGLNVSATLRGVVSVVGGDAATQGENDKEPEANPEKASSAHRRTVVVLSVVAGVGGGLLLCSLCLHRATQSRRTAKSKVGDSGPTAQNAKPTEASVPITRVPAGTRREAELEGVSASSDDQGGLPGYLFAQ